MARYCIYNSMFIVFHSTISYRISRYSLPRVHVLSGCFVGGFRLHFTRQLCLARIIKSILNRRRHNIILTIQSPVSNIEFIYSAIPIVLEYVIEILKPPSPPPPPFRTFLCILSEVSVYCLAAHPGRKGIVVGSNYCCNAAGPTG